MLVDGMGGRRAGEKGGEGRGKRLEGEGVRRVGI